MNNLTFRDAIAEHLKARPYTWVSAYDLMKIGGALAFRTRVSEARRQLSMRIENRVTRDANGVAHSYYRFCPAESSVPRQGEMNL